jgi:hypothetical protein
MILLILLRITELWSEFDVLNIWNILHAYYKSLGALSPPWGGGGGGGTPQGN